MTNIFLCLGLVLLLQSTQGLDFAGDVGFGGDIGFGGGIGGVDVVDNCDPMVRDSCGAGKCCVKESMMYIPEAPGPKPAYRLRCLSLAAEGQFCSTHNTTEMCPCASGLTCKATLGYFGHCRK